MSNGQTVCGVIFGPLDSNVTNNITKQKKNSIESILNAANHWYALSYYFYVLMVDVFFFSCVESNAKIQFI